MSTPGRILHTAHPWHDIAPRLEGSDLLRVYIEIVPGADLKFELDKPSGLLKIATAHSSSPAAHRRYTA